MLLRGNVTFGREFYFNNLVATLVFLIFIFILLLRDLKIPICLLLPFSCTTYFLIRIILSFCCAVSFSGDMEIQK